ncbi:HAD hydrolase-like protein [Sporohalobacter salinus]|uniref:HAD family hydrolase n=1 Tax=Sporohalobacter salinus TaxID=1494606 RepID=UPI00195F756E
MGITFEKLKGNKNSTCYIGDTTKDIQAAKNAGFKSVAVTWRMNEQSDLEQIEPDLIVLHTKELLKVKSIL